MPKTIAYLRVSTDQQDLNGQKLEILQYANTHGFKVDDFIAIEISSRKTTKERRIDELLDRLSPGDTLITSELSRIGRSIVEVINLINGFVEKSVRFIAIKQGLDIRKNQDINSKITTTIFSLLAEVERDLISQRTKSALAAKKAAGVVLGRPVGSTGNSKLDGKEGEIAELLKDKASKSFIARKFRVSRTTVRHFIITRKLTEVEIN